MEWTHPFALEICHELPHPVELSRPVQEGDLAEDLLEIRLGLLCALAQQPDRPPLALLEATEELVEELVARHTRHALELAFRRLLLRFLQSQTRRPSMSTARGP